jgi:hypothetical protein
MTARGFKAAGKAGSFAEAERASAEVLALPI